MLSNPQIFISYSLPVPALITRMIDIGVVEMMAHLNY